VNISPIRSLYSANGISTVPTPISGRTSANETVTASNRGYLILRIINPTKSTDAVIRNKIKSVIKGNFRSLISAVLLYIMILAIILIVILR
jgi:RNase P protein component